MSGTHVPCYAGDLVLARQTSEIGDQSSGVKDPIGDNRQTENELVGVELREGLRYCFLLPLFIFFRVVFSSVTHDIPNGK